MHGPSTNGTLPVGATQHRVVVDIVLSFGGGCLGAACVARWLFGAGDVNTTLARGVAFGRGSDIITFGVVAGPWAAATAGFYAKAFSAFLSARIGPSLSRTMNVQDSRGVNTLCGTQGILGPIVSIITIAISTGEGSEVTISLRLRPEVLSVTTAQCKPTIYWLPLE